MTARARYETARRHAQDAQRRVNVCQEELDVQANVIARCGRDGAPAAFHRIYEARDERLRLAVQANREARLALAQAHAFIAVEAEQTRAAEIAALRDKLLGGAA